MTNREVLALLLEWIKLSLDQGCSQEAANIWKIITYVLNRLNVNTIFDETKPHQSLSDIMHHQFANIIDCASSSSQFNEKFIILLYKYFGMEFEFDEPSDPNVIKFENHQKSVEALQSLLGLLMKRIEAHPQQEVIPHIKNTKLLSILQFTINYKYNAPYEIAIDNHKDLVFRLLFNLCSSKDLLIKEHGGNFDFLLSAALISYLQSFLANEKNIDENKKQSINKFLQKLQGSMAADAIPSFQANLIHSMQKFGLMANPTNLPHKTAGAFPPGLFEIPAAAEIAAIQAKNPTVIDKINEALGPDFVQGNANKTLCWVPEGSQLTLQGKALSFDKNDAVKAEKQKRAIIRRLSILGISETQIRFEPFPTEPHKARLVLINLDNLFLKHSQELINKPAADAPAGKRERRGP